MGLAFELEALVGAGEALVVVGDHAEIGDPAGTSPLGTLEGSGDDGVALDDVRLHGPAGDAHGAFVD